MIYTVIVVANKEQNNGDKDYRQKYIVLDNEDNCVCIAEQFDNTSTTSSEFCDCPYPVIKRMVKHDTSEGALFKFLKWRREGLDGNYLLGDCM